jgi:hypothetical protein
VLTLAPFVLVASASSLLSLMRGIEPALGISTEARLLRGMLTLVIGCSFYMAMVMVHESVDDLRFSLRWISLGRAGPLWARSRPLICLSTPDCLHSGAPATFISIAPYGRIASPV